MVPIAAPKSARTSWNRHQGLALSLRWIGRGGASLGSAQTLGEPVEFFGRTNRASLCDGGMIDLA
jgi:hypothetical protein